MKGFQKLTSVEHALEIFMETVPSKKLKSEEVVLSSALGRVLAESVVAVEDLPRFDRSAVDGYALRADETVAASQFKPKTIKVVEHGIVSEGQAKQVWTGNAIPKGANAVVMLENVKRVGGGIEVWVALTPGENVSKKGEDMAKGKTAAKAGVRLTPYHLALVAALGKTEVTVFAKPVVAVLATGNELVEIGGKLRSNQIFDSNRIMISAMSRELGAKPLDLGMARDDVDEIANKLAKGLREADAVITTGGTSVGLVDLVPDAVNKTGKPGVVVHGVAMRPGMPTALAVANRKPILVLSGNPVAAVVGFEAFARPLICRLLGLKQTELRPAVKARLAKRVVSALGRKTFVRVRVVERDGEFVAEPVSARGSGTISTMTEANGFVVVAEDREGLEEGEVVSVSLFDSIREAGASV
jgi:molybdenum cofactor synthesis domain-containing protein